MVNFFTDPYPHELLYSAIARYHNLSANTNLLDTNYEMYGVEKAVPVVYFGYNLDYLVNQLGGSYTLDELINYHTIFLYYRPFVTLKVREECINGMRKTNSNYLRLYIFNNKIFEDRKLYYCPECAKEDIEKFGELYFHVQHQLEGITICPIHRVYLESYQDNRTWNNINEYICIDNKNIKFNSTTIPNSEFYNKLYRISTLANELFKVDTSVVSREKLVKYYRNVLYEKGYVSHNGMVKQEKLKSDILDFYGIDFLINLNSNLIIKKRDTWIKYILEDSERLVHPIRHLIFINFLGRTIKNIVNDIDNTYSPFGPGPWSCINKICQNYKGKVVKLNRVYVCRYSMDLVGEFECEFCGFKFIKSIKDVNEDYNYKKIINYGQTWYNKLYSYAFVKKMSIAKIAKEMDCSYTTIQYHLNKLKNENNINFTIKKINIVKLNKAKEIILNIIKVNKNISRSELKNQNNKEYTLIYRNDIEWFTENMPKVKISRTNESDKLLTYRKCFLEILNNTPNINRQELQKKLRWKFSYLLNNDSQWFEQNAPKIRKTKEFERCIDWDKRDDELLKLLIDKYKVICSRNDLTKISISLLNREILEVPINPYTLSRTPKSREYIDNIIDTTETYRMKCYKKYLNDNYKQNLYLCVNDIISKFSTLRRTNIKVIDELNEYISSLHNSYI